VCVGRTTIRHAHRCARWHLLSRGFLHRPTYASLLPAELAAVLHDVGSVQCPRRSRRRSGIIWFISIEPTADLAEAAKLVSTRRIGVLVVLDSDKRLAGILSEPI
jgi:hypothetical protein